MSLRLLTLFLFGSTLLPNLTLGGDDTCLCPPGFTPFNNNEADDDTFGDDDTNGDDDNGLNNGDNGGITPKPDIPDIKPPIYKTTKPPFVKPKTTYSWLWQWTTKDAAPYTGPDTFTAPDNGNVAPQTGTTAPPKSGTTVAGYAPTATVYRKHAKKVTNRPWMMYTTKDHRAWNMYSTKPYAVPPKTTQKQYVVYPDPPYPIPDPKPLPPKPTIRSDGDELEYGHGNGDNGDSPDCLCIPIITKKPMPICYDGWDAWGHCIDLLDCPVGYFCDANGGCCPELPWRKSQTNSESSNSLKSEINYYYINHKIAFIVIISFISFIFIVIGIILCSYFCKNKDLEKRLIENNVNYNSVQLIDIQK